MRSVLLILLLGVSCTRQPALVENPELFEAPVSIGTVEAKQARETSGMAASINNPGMFWIHADSGNPADIYLIDKQGAIRGTVHLKGIKNRDWEEIAISATEDGTFLYIGEIGDNMGRYKNKMLYRIKEPLLDSLVSDTTISRIEKITFNFDDGPRDSEAFMVDPKTQDVYIFSKRELQMHLYKLKSPLLTTEEMTADRVLSELPFSLIVAADISKDGSEILAKNYQHVFYWKREGNESIEETLKKPAAVLPYTPEPQGEAIAFDRGGLGYYTLSERTKKVPQHLFFYKRK